MHSESANAEVLSAATQRSPVIELNPGPDKGNPMNLLFVFLFSVPCLTTLFIGAWQLFDEHTADQPSLPIENFRRPTARVQFGSVREIVPTAAAPSPLQPWAARINPIVTPGVPLAARPVQPSAGAPVKRYKPMKDRYGRSVPALSQRGAKRKPEPALPLVLPNQQIAAKPPAQPASH
jgi:hypothetical protein